MDRPYPEITWMGALRLMLVIAAFILFWYLRDIMILMLAAIVIAAALEHPISLLMRRGIKRFAAATIIYLSGLVFVSVAFYFILPTLALQLKDLVFTLLRAAQGIELPFLIPDIEAFLQQHSQDWSAILSAIGGGAMPALTFLAGTVGMLFSALLVFVISFYITLQEKWVERALKVLAPKRYEDYLINLWARSERKIGIWLYTQVILSLITGTVVFIGLLILNIENALALAILTAISNLVPIIGGIFAGAITFLVAVQQGWYLGLYAILLFIAAQQLEVYVFSPAIRQKILGISPAMILLALLIGERLAGFWGVVIALPLAAGISEFYSDLEKRELKN